MAQLLSPDFHLKNLKVNKNDTQKIWIFYENTQKTLSRLLLPVIYAFIPYLKPLSRYTLQKIYIAFIF